MIIRILFNTFGGGSYLRGACNRMNFLFTGRQFSSSLLFYTDQLSGHHAYNLNYISFFDFS